LGYQTEKLLANIKSSTSSNYEVNNYWNYATMQWDKAGFNWETTVVVSTVQDGGATKNGLFSDVLGL